MHYITNGMKAMPDKTVSVNCLC